MDASPPGKAESARYQRQVAITELGTSGQEKLLQSSVLCVGAGGLGCPALVYLAAAGVGRIGIADSDDVELSNLHRQVLYTNDDIGKPKVICAADRLGRLNDDVKCESFKTRLNRDNVKDLVNGYDVVLCCTDNYESRFVLNDACFKRGKPLVVAGILGLEGYVIVSGLGGVGPCLRCFMPEPPPADAIRSPADVGVLGAAVGVLGCLEAMQAIKIIAGFGEPLAGRILTYKALDESFRTVALKPDPQCKTCAGART